LVTESHCNYPPYPVKRGLTSGRKGDKCKPSLTTPLRKCACLSPLRMIIAHVRAPYASLFPRCNTCSNPPMTRKGDKCCAPARWVTTPTPTRRQAATAARALRSMTLTKQSGHNRGTIGTKSGHIRPDELITEEARTACMYVWMNCSTSHDAENHDAQQVQSCLVPCPSLFASIFSSLPCPEHTAGKPA